MEGATFCSLPHNLTLFVLDDHPNSTAFHTCEHSPININFVPPMSRWAPFCSSRGWTSARRQRLSCHLLRMLPSLHSNSLWVFAPPFMLESIPIIPHHPCCDGKKHPVQDAILYFQHPNHINKVLHGLLQIREIKANFLPHPSSNIAVPSWPDDSKPPQSPQLLSKVTLLNAR